jgi:hypothetical protein
MRISALRALCGGAGNAAGAGVRPDSVPPAEVWALRDYTRARAHLVQDRTRAYQRLEQVLEGALIKVSSVASRMTTLSVGVTDHVADPVLAGERHFGDRGCVHALG